MQRAVKVGICQDRWSVVVTSQWQEAKRLVAVHEAQAKRVAKQTLRDKKLRAFHALCASTLCQCACRGPPARQDAHGGSPGEACFVFAGARSVLIVFTMFADPLRADERAAVAPGLQERLADHARPPWHPPRLKQLRTAGAVPRSTGAANSGTPLCLKLQPLCARQHAQSAIQPAVTARRPQPDPQPAT